MKKNRMTVTAVVLGIIAVSGTVFAYGGGFSTENIEAIQNAIASNDYNTWKELMMQQLTEKRFNNIVNRYQNRQEIINALQNGDYDAWKTAVENMQQTRLDSITEEDFSIMSQNYQAIASGDGNTNWMGFGHRMFGHFMGGMGWGMKR